MSRDRINNIQYGRGGLGKAKDHQEFVGTNNSSEMVMVVGYRAAGNALASGEGGQEMG